MCGSRVVCVVLTAIASVIPCWAQHGHDIDYLRSRVTVSGSQQWQQWEFPHGTIDITEDGVRPRFWRKGVNASLDILDNIRLAPPAAIADKLVEEITLHDAVRGSSNENDVINILDGDMTTYWEPAAPRGITDLKLQWRFTVDMGQLVMADRIVLRFVDEELGDPFSLFDVFVSDGQKPPSNLAGDDLDFTRVFRTVRPIKSHRVFEIDVADLATRAPRKRLVRFVEVAITGSDLARGREIDETEYQRLRAEAPADTGLVEHTKLLLSGGLLPVSISDWERLEEDHRGPVRYFRRERPRLAELEVWSEGDNLFSDIVRRGGSVPDSREIFHLANIADRDLGTKVGFTLDPFTRGTGGRFDHSVLDLGSQFWIDGYRHVLTPTNEHAATFGQWALDFSDGALEADGSLTWNRKSSIEAEPLDVRTLVLESIDFEPIRARFMRIQYFAHPDYLFLNANVAALQLIGRGYQPEVTLVSEAIRFEDDRSRNLVSIEWEADTPAGTSVSLQTRTGTGLDMEYCFYKKLGGNTRPLIGTGDDHCAVAGSQEAIALAEKFPKPGAGAKPDRIDTLDFLDESRFSSWSEVYTDPSGSEITSPSPRPVLLISATLRSDDPDAHATLKSVTLNFDDPVANRLVGSLTPTRVETMAVDQGFSLVVQLDTLQLGLDELLLVSPPGMELLRDPAPLLYAGTVAQLQDGQDMSALTRASHLILPREGISVGDSLYLSFAAIEADHTSEAIRLEFTGRLFSPGGRLGAQLRNSGSRGGNWQRIDQEHNSLVVVAQPPQKELFRDLAVVPSVFTPNGDDRNEQTRASFILLSVGAGTAVAVEVYDLSGRLLRRLQEERDSSAGLYQIPWDGRDEGGRLVAPGMYVVKVKLAGSTAGSGLDRVEALRSVAVAY